MVKLYIIMKRKGYLSALMMFDLLEGLIRSRKENRNEIMIAFNRLNRIIDDSASLFNFEFKVKDNLSDKG